MEKRVLLVDADESYAERIASGLVAAGIDVTAVTDDERAITSARNAAPDLVILGRTTALDRALLRAELASVEPLANVPILLVDDGSADGAPGERIERDASVESLAQRIVELTSAEVLSELDLQEVDDDAAGADVEALLRDEGGDESHADVEAILRADHELRDANERLEEELFSVRTELGSKIAELEGEVAALREEDEARLKELSELHARLADRDEGGGAGGANPVLLKMLHAELSDAQTGREQAEAELARLRADRERMQDELAGQLAELAGQLAAKETENAALRRRIEQLEGETPAADPGALAAELEDLRAENEFLHGEVDRLAGRKDA